METVTKETQSCLDSNTMKERMIAANNKRAYELLLRIQQQYQQNTVVAVVPKREVA